MTWLKDSNTKLNGSNVSNPVEAVVSCDLHVNIVCDFVKTYEKEKFRIMHEGGELLSVSCFMLDYCGKIRSKSN